MVEAYRPEYLHSYFFYDRSLMALVAGYLINIPRGISCYADHLLKDYELKVVPLHLELCDIVIATSERIKQELLEIAPQTDPNRILVKPNGIDTECFPVMQRAEPADGAPFRLVSVCRIEPKKGLIDLVEAVSLLRQRGLNVEAHIVGTVDEWSQASRDYKRKLDKRISDLSLWGKIHLEGRQNLDGVHALLGIAQLFVAPFVETESGDKDGIPTALLEGMATGLPAVATDAGSIAEVIEDGCEGVLVSQRDPVGLANAIEGLIRDPDCRSADGLKGCGQCAPPLRHRRLREDIPSTAAGPCRKPAALEKLWNSAQLCFRILLSALVTNHERCFGSLEGAVPTSGTDLHQSDAVPRGEAIPYLVGGREV